MGPSCRVRRGQLYLLMYANSRPGAESPAAQQAFALLGEHMQRVAAAGRLRVGLGKACALYHAAAVGLVMSLLARAPAKRDPELSRFVRDHALRGSQRRRQPRPLPLFSRSQTRCGHS